MTRSRTFRTIAVLVIGVTAPVALGASVLNTARVTKTVGAEQVDSVTATCKQGTRVVSGGFAAEFIPGGASPLFLVTTSSREGRRKWTTTAANEGEPGDLTTYAYCRDQRLKRVSETAVDPSSQAGSFTVRCPGNKNAISGGYAMTPADFVGDTPVYLNSASHRIGNDRWRVSTVNNGNDPGELSVFAYCRGGDAPKERTTTKSLDDPGSTVVTPVKARCKRDERVVAGGFASTGLAKGAAQVLASRKRGSRNWLVRARTGGQGAPADVTSFAYCEKR